MKKLVLTIFIVLSSFVALPTSLLSSSVSAAGLPTGQADCNEAKQTTFFGLPVWYKYLPYEFDREVKECRVEINFSKRPQDVALIGFAAIDILLRLAGMLAFAYVVYGGFTYIISRGEPDKAAAAKSILLNAIIGLAITIIAANVVAFIAVRLT